MSVRGFDVSNYTAVPDLPTFKALCESEHFERILIGSQFVDTFMAWYDLAKQTDIAVYGWLYLYNIGSPYNPDNLSYAQQLLNNLEQLPTADIIKFYLDVEDTTGTLPNESNIVDALQVVQIPHGIYTGSWYWPSIGNPQIGTRCSLWDANYDNNPDNFAVNYGGWTEAEVKQYRGDYTSFGMTIDLDSWSD